MTEQGRLVSTEPGGLGNRIKSWVSAMRLDDNAGVYWPILDNMPARFSELFANDCGVDSVPEGAIRHESWRLAILPEDEPLLPEGFAVVGAGSHPIVRGVSKLWWQLTGQKSDRYRYMVFPKAHSRRSTRADARHIDLEYERIPEALRERWRPYFDRIEVQPHIVERVDAFARETFTGPVVGVQVRTWRDYPKRHKKYYLPSVPRLKQLIEAADSSARLFVVSDSDDVAPWLAEAYGRERVFTYPRRTERHQSWQSVHGMEEDLTDMLLLARTDRLIASYLSTFSETAWWLGGARAPVSVF